MKRNGTPIRFNSIKIVNNGYVAISIDFHLKIAGSIQPVVAGVTSILWPHAIHVLIHAQAIASVLGGGIGYALPIVQIVSRCIYDCCAVVLITASLACMGKLRIGAHIALFGSEVSCNALGVIVEGVLNARRRNVLVENVIRFSILDLHNSNSIDVALGACAKKIGIKHNDSLPLATDLTEGGMKRTRRKYKVLDAQI